MQEQDRYGRLLAYLYLADGTMLNELLFGSVSFLSCHQLASAYWPRENRKPALSRCAALTGG